MALSDYATSLAKAINPFSRNSLDPNKTKKDLRNTIAPIQLQRFAQDVKTWREAMGEAENVWYPHRVKQQRLFIDTVNNGHVSACMDRRKDLTMLRKWEFVNKKGKIDQYTTELFLDTVNNQSQNKKWFNDLISFSLDAIFYGYSLITLGDIVNDSFPDLDVIKRWNVSPDRLNVNNFIYSISGTPFLEEPYRDWHVYVSTNNEIGSSRCGFGLLYKVALYEVYLRNILGQNADFTELYSQPYRVGKTTKTDENERKEFAQAIEQMGSAGWAMLDPEDEILFLETALGGTGYKGYADFELRLEKKISKLILGHADAIDSIAGKLGNSNEKSPAEFAMQDKATKDGSFISNIINNTLIVNMRALGFAIPEDVKAVLKNDAEINEYNNSVIAQAVEIKKAGLQIDAEEFTRKTGIKVTSEVVTSPKPTFTPDIKNKLKKIYNKTNCDCGNIH